MASLLGEASSNGVHWVLSYNDAPDVRDLYRNTSVSTLSLPIDYYYNRPQKDNRRVKIRKSELLMTNSFLTPARRRLAHAVFDRDRAIRL